jgi:molybdate transport system ATP-binding protein
VPMVFVSHDPTEVQVLCDELCLLERGRVVARGEPHELLRVRAEPGQAFENVLTGVVTESGNGSARVWIGEGLELSVPDTGLEPGAELVLGLDADDVLVSRAPLAGISARNVLRGRIGRIEHGPRAAQLEVALDPDGVQRLLVGITPASVRELGLERGGACWLVFKASSLRVLSARPKRAAAAPAPNG